ncbi:ATP-binding protein [Streptomyces sp. GQFP]|uniref:ATP-binding protein n=1 Tax=Streptomyces sp. GQFP TaxID=2907545 RepID=UPI001F23DE11|nr:AAA family ATPase [Streptomyces sp. GQFP]UIX32499.1 AAA family ATPase [Streptomyces sp. GQFP]
MTPPGVDAADSRNRPLPELLGREWCLRLLEDRFEAALAGQGGLVLITGEAGMGKTSVVRWAVREAERHGMRVLRGTCWEASGTPDHWPWIQVVRALCRSRPADQPERLSGAGDPAVRVLLGEGTGGEEVTRFQLCATATELLSAAARQQPLLVVFEDVHWADTASVELLEFVAQHAWSEPLLLAVTCRDTETERPGHRLASLLRSLAARATALPLRGLDRADAAELMARTARRSPGADVAVQVHRRTGGNPFFVEEIARLWAAGHPMDGISPGTRAVLERRLALLDPAVLRCLEAASVIGRAFDPGTLAAVLDAAPAQCERWLAAARDACLVERTEDGDAVFRHDLLRESLYGTLDAARVRSLHAAAFHAVRRRPGAAGSRVTESRVTEAARHAHLAGAELSCDDALEALVSAARHADDRMAHEEAVRNYSRALERLGTRPVPRRVLLALDLGRTLQLSGDHAASWRVFDEALRLAHELGDALLTGRTALVLYAMDGRGDAYGLKWRGLRAAHELLLPDAAVPATQSGMASRIAREVVETARSTGDDDSLQIGVWTRLRAEWGPETVPERRALVRELVEVARRRGDLWTAHVAMSERWVATLQAGDPAYLEEMHAMAAAATADGSRRTRLTSLIDRSVVYAATGRFDRAEQLLQEAVPLIGTHPNYYRVFLLQHRWSLCVYRGRFDEARALDPALRDWNHSHAELLQAITALEAGEEPVLSAPRAGPGAAGGDTVLYRSLTPLWLRHQSLAAAASGDPDLCGEALDALEPYAGQWLISLFGWDVGGPTELWAGLCEAARGRRDDAVRLLTEAWRSAERLRAGPWSVRARLELADLLSGAGSGPVPGLPTARELLDSVAADARRMDMPHLAERADRSRSAATPAVADAPANEFRRHGEVWRLTFGDRTVHLPDAKGLRDLHCLLGRPDREVPALQLLSPGDDETAAAGSMGADHVLDDEARARYRRHLDMLEAETDRAAARGDDRRAAALDRERAAVVGELRRAAGLAGRPRRLGDASERARKNVTGRIKDTLRRMDAHHPELAAHLRETVSTGVMCRYAPGREIRWRL